MSYADQSDVDLLNELQEAQMGRVDELERRLLALEAKAGVVSEGQYGPSRMLVAEGEQEDPQELTVEELRDWSHLPMAAGFTPGRHVVTEVTGAAFDLFDRGGEPSGTIDKSAAAQRLREVLAEAPANQADPDAEPSGGGVFRPADYRGVPVARGF
jgi:hypothetical protein